jgi:SAM-dependent methyltransferase
MAEGRAITDLFRWGGRRPDPESVPAAADVDPDPLYPTKAFQKFLGSLSGRDAPVLLDLGPVVGTNVSFFGETLGCKIFVEDLYADIERHARASTLDAFPAFLETRLPQADASVDGILCWDLLDYLDRRAAQALAPRLARLLRPGGAILGFFSTTDARLPNYTKYVVVNEQTLRHRPYAATLGRQRALLNRDIIRLFEGLQVSESFLLKNNTREILFRKPI